MSINWKEYWNKNISSYGSVAKFYRRNLFALEGKIYSEKFFPEKGVFIECGSGTSECSIKIAKKRRHGIAFDLCREPLKNIHAPIIENGVQGTIYKLPFKDNTIDGIWNFGVMEHFKEDDLNFILREFNRILKSGGRIILFWPWAYSPLSLSFSLREFVKRILSKFGIRLPEVYPDVFMLFSSKNDIQFILENCGFSQNEFRLSPYGIFTHYVVIASK